MYYSVMTRQEKRLRDEKLIKDYLDGVKPKDISHKYRISLPHVFVILRQYKEQYGGV
jgi:Mor family transcriptional regulator